MKWAIEKRIYIYLIFSLKRNDQISISGEDPEIRINITEENGETFYEPEIKFANEVSYGG